MHFNSDRQRRAVFAKLGKISVFSISPFSAKSPFSMVTLHSGAVSNALLSISEQKGSFPPKEVLSSSPKYVFDEKPVDQFSARSDYENIIKNLKNVEDNPKYASELREKARREREKAEMIWAEKFIGKEEIEVSKPVFEEVITQEDIDSYMRRHALKSVPSIQEVADEKAELELAGKQGVVVYRTPADSYADYQKYLKEETKKLEGENK